MTKLKAAFTYRDPEVTIDYPKGWDGLMPKKHEKAAQEADAIEEDEDGNDGSADEARPPRRTRRAKG